MVCLIRRRARLVVNGGRTDGFLDCVLSQSFRDDGEAQWSAVRDVFIESVLAQRVFNSRGHCLFCVYAPRGEKN
jgi:hypothetical protein